ncbi:MAG: hypothetical protein PHX29_04760 [Dehalococcoidales bacterium]|jgi:hypothetical protein|nr:hypothetical protein [Dehalococcoidales bacterium]
MYKENIKDQVQSFFKLEAEMHKPKPGWWQEAISRASAHEQISSDCGFENHKCLKRSGFMERMKYTFESLAMRKRAFPVKLSVYIALALLFLGLSAGIGIVMANMGKSENPPVVEPNELAIIINGLAQGEEAFLHLGTQSGRLEIENLVKSRQVESDCAILMEDLVNNLEDGYYLLVLEVPEHYFRDPKGYSFMVQDSVIVNPHGSMFNFKLEEASSHLPKEAIIAFSGPSKEPIQPVPLPLWQRLLQPAAITGAAIIVIMLVIFVRHRRLKANR